MSVLWMSMKCKMKNEFLLMQRSVLGAKAVWRSVNRRRSLLLKLTDKR